MCVWLIVARIACYVGCVMYAARGHWPHAPLRWHLHSGALTLGADVQVAGQSVPLFAAEAVPETVVLPAASLVVASPAPPYNPAIKLPAKLTAKIESLQFIEMAELLPEAWALDGQAAPTDGFGKPVRRAVISDLMIWCECFTLMAAVLARKFPDRAPDLFAYMRRVMRAARNFEGAGWVLYDRIYRRQALATPGQQLNWAVEDTTLYNEVFVGHARIIPRCTHCLSEHHTLANCPDATCPPYWQYHVAPATAPVAPMRSLPAGSPQPSGHRPEVCKKFNEDRCFMRRCKYTHACLVCEQPHPAALCPRLARSGKDDERNR